MSETGYTQEIRFSRKSGKQGGGGWGARYLVMPTDEGRVQVNMNILTGKARNLLNSVVIPKSVDKLKEFIDEMAKWQNV
jgi:hypothetical protein